MKVFDYLFEILLRLIVFVVAMPIATAVGSLFVAVLIVGAILTLVYMLAGVSYTILFK